MATSTYQNQHHPLPSLPQRQESQPYNSSPSTYYAPPLPQQTSQPQQQGYQQQPQYYQQQQQQQRQQYNPAQVQQPAHQYQQHQNPQARPSVAGPSQQPRNKPRGFSFRSDKSHKSSDSATKISLQETSAEKEAKRLHSKADPTLAMHEAEPSAIAAQAADKDAVLRPLSSIQHKGIDGLPIGDPDRSNPTRSRWERPLETIRSFEAAIDSNYSRKSIYRAETESVGGWNRRSSYYAQNGPRFPQDSYYGSRPHSMYRPESMMYDSRQMNGGGYNSRDNYSEGYDNGKNRYSRVQSEPQLSRFNNSARNVYPMPNNHQSHETVASGSGSGSEPAGYQTDPTSSENSSMGRRSPPKRQEPTQDYGIKFGQPTYQSRTFAPTASAASTSGPPPVPRKEVGGSLLRKGSKANVAAAPTPQARPAMGEKRKSWFSRRFSKN